MIFKKYNSKTINIFVLIVIMLMTTSCKEMILMHPQGEIGLEERSLILIAIILMLVVVIPVIVMTIIFSFKYRASNITTTYAPDWDRSNKIELIVWIIPVIIITLLAIITWKTTHDLDPSKSIQSNTQPINIEVVALDWKWLFIYPEKGIATLNEIAFPNNVPVTFKITSNSVMNSFFIPQLGSQIYAMAGMNNTLNLIANKSGKYEGISSNFSGSGFSGMKFNVIVTPNQHDFDLWLKKIKLSPYKIITMEQYEKLAKPNQYPSIKYFSYVKQNLYKNIIDKFMD